MRLMNLDEIQYRMADVDVKKVSETTGLSYTCVYNVKHQRTKNLKLDTLTLLTQYFEARDEQTQRFG